MPWWSRIGEFKPVPERVTVRRRIEGTAIELAAQRAEHSKMTDKLIQEDPARNLRTVSLLQRC